MSAKKLEDPSASRYCAEIEFHDTLAANPDALRARFYRWGLEEAAEEFALSRLGPLAGKTVVDYGCGAGRFAARLAQDGARVVAFDLSSGMLRHAAARARQTETRGTVWYQRMSAEQLALRSESVHIIYGQSILHHLNLEPARAEIVRVLAPNGRAVFLEPLAHNPILNLYRWLTPHRRSRDERPLSVAEVTRLAGGFRRYKHREFGLLTLLAVPLTLLPSPGPFQAALRLLRKLDQIVLGLLPFLRKFCWITVIELEK